MRRPRPKKLLAVYDTYDNNVTVLVGTYNEIAEWSGLSLKAVKSDVSRGSKLKRRYAVEKLGFKEGEENIE